MAHTVPVHNLASMYLQGVALLGGRICWLNKYLEGQGYLVSRLIAGIARVAMLWVIGVTSLFPNSP